MKNYLYLFISLFLFVSCEEDEKVTDPIIDQVNKLNGTWKIEGSNSIIFNGQNVNSFSEMTLNFSDGSKDGGKFSTTHNELTGTEVWPFEGTWSFLDTADPNNTNSVIKDINTIVRSDMVGMDLLITETSLRLTFRVADCLYICSPGNYDGDWVFNFIKL